MVQYPIPKRVSIEDIKDILKAYYVEGAHDGPVSTSAVEDTAQLPDRVGRQTDFLEGVGLLEKEGRQRVLTSAGAEIAEALMGGGEEMAKSRMREALTDWEFTSKIQGFVRMQGPVEEGQLLEYITANVESGDTRGKRTLLEIFQWADILSESEEGVYSVVESKPSSEKDSEEEPSEGENVDSGKGESKHQGEGGSRGTDYDGITRDHINIEFTFTADDDPKDIQKSIVAARKGLAEDIGDDDSELAE